MKRMKAITSQQLRNRLARYKRFASAMENHLNTQTPIHDLVPTLGTGDPAVYLNPYFKTWISRNRQRNRAMNKIKDCDHQLLQNLRDFVPEGTSHDGATIKPVSITSLPVKLTESLAFLETMRKTRMPLDERAELLIGTLLNLAGEIVGTVTDWSQPRPVMPLSAWQAWGAAHKLVEGQVDGLGDAAWEHACKSLRNDLAAGYAMWRDDIA